MKIDMEVFRRTFFEESFEGLEIMESSLLEMEAGSADRDAIDNIFRAAHSIKGGSGTFGFAVVAEFTHLLETLLDEMRDGKREAGKALIDTLLKSVDCLRDLLRCEMEGRETDPASYNAVESELRAHLESDDDTAPEASNESEEQPEDTQTDSSPEEAVAAWNISFKPDPELFGTGNEPIRILRELASLGRLEVRADLDSLPSIEAIDPEECYLKWEMVLHSKESEATIRQVFEWVEDHCALDVRKISSESVASETPKQQDESRSSVPSAECTQGHQSSRDESNKKKVSAESPAKKQAVRKTNASDAGSIRVGIEKIDTLVNMVGELVITQAMLGALGKQYDGEGSAALRDGLAQLERNTLDLQDSVMRIRMLPIGFAFSRLPRIVHDLNTSLGKKAELKITGESTELDKTVLEKIGDPLVHLVRNAIDHGIEAPDVRRAAGKDETGSINLTAYHKGGNIYIEIKDDGAGINPEVLLAKAREKGIVDENETLSRDRIIDLIFDPGFSTAKEVSAVSGRGVGMDVVRRNIKALGGQIEVSSELGVGSTFSIRLPLTMAILDGQLVRVGDHIYIIPLISIVETLQIKADSVNSIAGRAELYNLRNEYLSIIRLHRILGVEPDSDSLRGGLLVVVEGDGQRAGLFIDDLLGQQQVVIKSLEANFKKINGVSGATILGDGSVAMILDIPGLITMSQCEAGVPPELTSREEPVAVQ